MKTSIVRIIYCLIMLMSVLPTNQAFAELSEDDQRIINYETLYYIENDENLACADGEADAKLTGDNVKDALLYFMSKGFKDYQAAAIIGNLQQESGPRLDPKIQQDRSKDPNPKAGVGFGIAQWTYADRQQPLVDLAKKLGKPASDLGVQLQYVWQELNTTHKSALTALEATPLYEDAAIAVAIYYGGCAFCKNEAMIRGSREKVRITNTADILALAHKNGWSAGPNMPGNGLPLGGGCTGASLGASGNKIVQIALKQVGVHENNGNNAGGACKYQGPGCPPGEFWCADFVSWVYKEAGTPFTGGDDGGWRIAGAVALSTWFIANGTWIANPHKAMPIDDPKAPKPGDVVLYPGSDGTGHVNIVVSYDGKTVKTVGGNQSDAVTTSDHNVIGTAIGWGRKK